MSLLKTLLGPLSAELNGRITRAAQIGLTDTRQDWAHITLGPARTVHLGYAERHPEIPRFGSDPAEVEW